MGEPPASVIAYIEDMLRELAEMARIAGEPGLAPPIEAAAAVAERVRSQKSQQTLRSNGLQTDRLTSEQA